MSLYAKLILLAQGIGFDTRILNIKANRALKNNINNKEISLWIPVFNSLPTVLGTKHFSYTGSGVTCDYTVESNISELKRFKFTSLSNNNVSIWQDIKNCRFGNTLFSSGFKCVYRFAFDDTNNFNEQTMFFIGLSDTANDSSNWDLYAKNNKIGFGFEPNNSYFNFYFAGTNASSIALNDLGAINNKHVYEFSIAHNGRENKVRYKASNLTTDTHVYGEVTNNLNNNLPDESIALCPCNAFRKSIDNSSVSFDLMFYSCEKLPAITNAVYPGYVTNNDLNLTELVSGSNDLDLI